MRYDSKAAKIFLAEEFDFHDEDVLWKKLDWFFKAAVCRIDARNSAKES